MIREIIKIGEDYNQPNVQAITLVEFQIINVQSIYSIVKCTRNVKVKSMFPKSSCQRQVRNQNKYFVNFATTERYLKSSIPFMQRMLNSEHKQKSKLIRHRGS